MISMFCPLTNSLKIWISWSHDILSLSDSFTHTQNFNKLFWKTPVVYHFFVLSYCSILFKWWKFNLMSAERNVFLLFNDLICCLVFININRTCLKVLHTQSLVSMSTKWAQRWWGEDGKKIPLAHLDYLSLCFRHDCFPWLTGAQLNLPISPTSNTACG